MKTSEQCAALTLIIPLLTPCLRYLAVLCSQHFYLTFHNPPMASKISANTNAYSIDSTVP